MFTVSIFDLSKLYCNSQKHVDNVIWQDNASYIQRQIDKGNKRTNWTHVKPKEKKRGWGKALAGKS
jgi:hypothetical protein